MKKLLIISLLLLSLFGCEKKMTMNDAMKEPSFKGIVQEVNESSILVLVNENDEFFKYTDLIWVSLDVEVKDGLSEYEVGDEVCVYHEDYFLESYPPQLPKVYAITIINEKK